jgi:glycosyltransferase involved in cell wall biosynthesis
MVPISVIVPNYNSGVFLSESIESINSGQWPAEILIIDDFSTDGSLELALKLQEKYSNVRVLKREENGGAAEARRLGISEATQHLIAFVDADDLIEIDALKEAYLEIIASDSDICIWELWRFDEDNEWKHDANPRNFPITGAEAVLLTLEGWRIHGLGVSRKHLYERAYQGFSEVGFNADELLTRLVFSNAQQVVSCAKKYFYRSNPSSSTRALNARSVTALRSHLWLLNFALRYPDAPVKKMARGAIGSAWFYWRRRKQIGVPATLRELRIFLAGLYRFPNLLSLLWQSPKHLGGLLFLSIVVWVQF